MTCELPFKDLVPAAKLIASVIYILSAIVASVGNTISLVILFQRSQRSSKSNKILTSLAISDCLVGFVCFPLAALILNLKDLRCTPIFLAYVFASIWLTGCSTCSVSFISYDRYIALTKYARYDEILTDCKIYSVVSLYGVLMLAFSSFCLAEPLVYYFGSPLIIIGSVITLCTCYYFVWKAFQQSEARIREISNTNNDAKTKRRHKRAHRLARKVLNLIAFYLAFYVPTLFFVVLSLIQAAKPKVISADFLSYTYYIMSYVGLSNSCCNPFIYLWRDREFRADFERLFWRRSGNIGRVNRMTHRTNDTTMATSSL
ncbi:histamine H2 receptor-like [Clytia hemisphaerica]|uniref:histamine H2 receptor-like n=1 Tax=Clytia hemisphaerica TaxID=252671 RepID=UPI0034D7329F